MYITKQNAFFCVLLLSSGAVFAADATQANPAIANAAETRPVKCSVVSVKIGFPISEEQRAWLREDGTVGVSMKDGGVIKDLADATRQKFGLAANTNIEIRAGRTLLQKNERVNRLVPYAATIKERLEV